MTDYGYRVIVIGPRVDQALDAYRVSLHAYEITGDAADGRAVERAALDLAAALDAAMDATEAL